MPALIDAYQGIGVGVLFKKQEIISSRVAANRKVISSVCDFCYVYSFGNYTEHSIGFQTSDITHGLLFKQTKVITSRL